MYLSKLEHDKKFQVWLSPLLFIPYIWVKNTPLTWYYHIIVYFLPLFIGLLFFRQTTLEKYDLNENISNRRLYMVWSSMNTENYTQRLWFWVASLHEKLWMAFRTLWFANLLYVLLNGSLSRCRPNHIHPNMWLSLRPYIWLHV